MQRGLQLLPYSSFSTLRAGDAAAWVPNLQRGESVRRLSGHTSQKYETTFAANREPCSCRLTAAEKCEAARYLKSKHLNETDLSHNDSLNSTLGSSSYQNATSNGVAPEDLMLCGQRAVLHLNFTLGWALDCYFAQLGFS